MARVGKTARGWLGASLLGLVGCGDDAPPAATGSSGAVTESTAGAAESSTDGVATGMATAGADASGTAALDSSSDGRVPVSGTLSVLTYNVAGLPQGISGSNPEQNIPQISPLLNAFELVLAQEDFWYHAELIADVEHEHLSDPFPDDPSTMGMGDGLNRMSTTAFGELTRRKWYDCNGTIDCSNDCLAKKGWSMARHTLAEGVEVDVYNLHMEAGGCPEDIEIRTQSALNLAEAIAERSDGRALIVAGDFNLRATDEEDVIPLANIVEGAGLTDVCDALRCGDQLIDHIMIRDGSDVTLSPQQWWIPEEFVDAASSEPLSDHLPVAAVVAWEG